MSAVAESPLSAKRVIESPLGSVICSVLVLKRGLSMNWDAPGIVRAVTECIGGSNREVASGREWRSNCVASVQAEGEVADDEFIGEACVL